MSIEGRLMEEGSTDEVSPKGWQPWYVYLDRLAAAVPEALATEERKKHTARICGSAAQTYLLSKELRAGRYSQSGQPHASRPNGFDDTSSSVASGHQMLPRELHRSVYTQPPTPLPVHIRSE